MTKLNLSPEAKTAKAAYQKAWAAKNRDKTRQYMANYWEHKGRELSGVDTLRQNTVSVTVINNSVTRHCNQCGVEFLPKRNTARFCSAACRVKYSRTAL
jgi:hypothetical protein